MDQFRFPKTVDRLGQGIVDPKAAKKQKEKALHHHP